MKNSNKGKKALAIVLLATLVTGAVYRFLKTPRTLKATEGSVQP